jgi:lipopolysaccharide transport system ATP-binding protein
MASEIAVRVQDLRKTYRIGLLRTQPETFRESVRQRVRHPLSRSSLEDFDAIKGINFEIAHGEAVGIVGGNGAGKSTLLKILSRITTPTAGRVDVFGRVGSLLEVGTGFHAELTGRENVYLNGAILGMNRRDIDRHFDSIVDFAGTEKFLDTPVKRYSSGMYVRLAFAVAAHLDPDILIVDEVLAVGDADFQKKCLERMGDVTVNQGRTVLFVSHNVVAVESFCTRGILLKRGEIVFDGDVREAIERYLSSTGPALGSAPGQFDLADVERVSPIVKPMLRQLTIADGEGRAVGGIRMGDDLTLTIDVEPQTVTERRVQIRILTDNDRMVATLSPEMTPLEVYDEKGHWEQMSVTVPQIPLLAGRYTIEIELLAGKGSSKPLDRLPRAGTFEVFPSDVYGTGFRLGTAPQAGVVYVDQTWELRDSGAVIAGTKVS